MSKFKERLRRRGFMGLLNSAEIDEIEQQAAEVYAHPTEPGWCCACEADIAFAEHYLRESKPEIFKPTQSKE